MTVRRRHLHVGIRGVNSFPKKAGGKITRSDCAFPISLKRRTLDRVEPESSFALLLIETVTGEAFVSKDGTDVPVVADRVFRPKTLASKADQCRTKGLVKQAFHVPHQSRGFG